MGIADLFRLDGRVAVITGASAGLGVAIAQAFAEVGADVVLLARRLEGLQLTADSVQETGRRALVVQTDVADAAQCQRAVDATMTEFGRVDVLVNNAGVGPVLPATRDTPDHFRSTIDINLNGSFWMAQACARVMEPGSAIVNVSSMLATTTLSSFPAAGYAASKAGVMGLTIDLAREWTGRKGIRVNALAPGFFRTEMTEAWTDTYQDALGDRLLVPRAGDPRELAAAALWLASDAAGYMTGQTIFVDGGVTIT
jgi:NAD(P)-dependent dehydrogenase (short-subunit alcohol dehydrogenase family)